MLQLPFRVTRLRGVCGIVYVNRLRGMMAASSGEFCMSTNNAAARPIRVLTIDDHPMLREGIAAALANQPDMQLVGEAANAKAGIEQYRLTRPDVALMDLQMPDMSGIDAIRLIREEFSEARILVLTTYQGDTHVSSALRAG